ncbi:hypothetical protein [Clostridium tyrobutyricum]|jgi:hypothetical protein|uniref:hypothetical protein n=1 Tax=Clostridium tyrobutyricum TaxID=1519 RepID=UPI001C388A02|nr:hypothetical protein [Clostridium tyrobutyricum]MBV4427187.1 hypothetical protein [Clostridium tyrobutyricum]MBV4442478.1 hypothetical protein [Clostridium tyrobutyricum]
MIKKGIVSSADNLNKIARIYFPDMDNNLTYKLKIVENVGEINTGNVVLVAFWQQTVWQMVRL